MLLSNRNSEKRQSGNVASTSTDRHQHTKLLLLNMHKFIIDTRSRRFWIFLLAAANRGINIAITACDLLLKSRLVL